ncbi:MAG: hypothetical protein HND44_02060 [Chloroflexi bacterium]|nr:hypothetical protein [Ardenticatenaceae bacterium]MBL1127283.1 hypothetical protein [Chloroflexota bacterium]NOG33344.1 hypothetical protein [Chloroflexota bacterium]GIK56168.1 MAG: hypothetical protein BroJett015_18310 [Chloroflexota bacterium]
MAAKTLAEAFNLLDPLRPVTPEQVPQLFVQRPYSPVDRIKAHLQMTVAQANRPQKLLFVGHRGAGKSSELAYLSTLLQDEFWSIFTPLYDVFQSPSVNHTEVIFAMYLAMLESATQEEFIAKGVVSEGWEKLMEHIYRPLRDFLFSRDPIPADTETSITIKLSLLVAELETKIGTESFTRNQVKEKFEGRIVDILDNIKQLTHLLEQRSGKRLLFIVEDLDKFDLESTRRLFQEHARTLTDPYPSIIYTFPVAMRYHNGYMSIRHSFNNAYLLPNISLVHRNGETDRQGYETMAAILDRRMSPDLWAEGVKEQLIGWSGGHARTAVQLSQQAILNAVVDKAGQVERPHLEEACKALRADYMSLLKREQITLLRALHQDPNKDLDDTTPEKQALLENGSLLEYANTRGYWADVNPLVRELLVEKLEG